MAYRCEFATQQKELKISYKLCGLICRLHIYILHNATEHLFVYYEKSLILFSNLNWKQRNYLTKNL